MRFIGGYFEVQNQTEQHERAKTTRKNIVCLFFIFSFFLFACDGSKGVFEEKDMCNLSENIFEFKKYLNDKYGDKLTLSDLESLQDEFVKIKDDVVDLRLADGEKLRFTGLSKDCESHDGVKYKFFIGALNHLDGSNFFQELFLHYDKSVFLTGRRSFSFTNMFGSKSDYQEVLSSSLVGRLNRSEVKEYLTSLGSSFKGLNHAENSDEHMDLYVYKVGQHNSLASIVGMWGFSKRIYVSYDEKNIVNKIHVK